MTRRAARMVGAIAFAALALLPACKTTVIGDSTATTAPDDTDDAPATTRALPPTVGARLAEIVTLATELGDLIVDGGDRPVLDRIDALWAASSAEIDDLEPALGREIVHQLELLHLGVERNRPAEADKATQNLSAVLQVYLERHAS